MKTFADELIAISRHFASFEREQVCCGDVTVPQCLVLQVLRAGERDISSLAGYAGSSVSAMTRLVDGLERRGWIERLRDPEDRRRVVVRLTDPGSQEASQLRAVTDAVVDQLFARIPKNKRKQVVESMQLVRAAMDELREVSDFSCG